VHHLILIGAYRDNDVDSATRCGASWKRSASGGPRARDRPCALDLRRFGPVTGGFPSLRTGARDSLAQLVHEKTASNPSSSSSSFIRWSRKVTHLDHADGRWFWDLDRIHAKVTPICVELMVGKLNVCPSRHRRRYKNWPCLGTALRSPRFPSFTRDAGGRGSLDLWEAVRLELIVRLERSYKFVHDRVAGGSLFAHH